MDSPLRCSCDSLCKSYGHRNVLNGCHLSVHAGEMVGLVGENGSGKSTLVRCLLGFTRLSGGRIWVHPSVGYCPQDNYLNNRLLLSEHLLLLSDIYRLQHEVDRSFVRMLVRKLHLDPYLRMRIGQLSSGTYQKAKFVTSVLHHPAMVILDEPCDGFDWAMYEAFWEIVTAMKADGSAVLMISHLLYDRTRFDRIYELQEGRCGQA
ncbi:MAG: ATP-binding cassette domain-containing protein [Spirochaetia bacterium]